MRNGADPGPRELFEDDPPLFIIIVRIRNTHTHTQRTLVYKTQKLATITIARSRIIRNQSIREFAMSSLSGPITQNTHAHTNEHAQELEHKKKRETRERTNLGNPNELLESVSFFGPFFAFAIARALLSPFQCLCRILFLSLTCSFLLDRVFAITIDFMIDLSDSLEFSTLYVYPCFISSNKLVLLRARRVFEALPRVYIHSFLKRN